MRHCTWLAAAAVVAICVPSEGPAAGPYVLTHLGELSGITGADINSQGHVVGHSVVASGVRRGFIWTPVTPNGTSGILDAMSPANAGGRRDQRRTASRRAVIGAFYRRHLHLESVVTERFKRWYFQSRAQPWNPLPCKFDQFLRTVRGIRNNGKRFGRYDCDARRAKQYKDHITYFFE